ncbi:hypothetical protein NDU88_001727 [Pleurodeles waltl]|uniref:Uncharacterized protein n=1 Tax=Pleurodeles waltl TaxID=8319 RepID=A0AAV7Q7Z9_PLEWA|nr:hypothetical protein NDU88_001727 [Pleurodeles waltl]
MTTEVTDGAIYSVPPRETPTPPLNMVTPFARTASGYFDNNNNSISDSFASSTSDLSGPRPKTPRRKRFLYEVYNEIWKLSQQEAAARLRQIDQENLKKALAVVDNGIHTLSDRIYTINNIVSSAIDIIRSDMLSLYHGQSQTRSIMQVVLGWTLQTLKAGRVPWQHISAREIFFSFNLTQQQQLMAKKEATYVMLNIEKLERLPFTVAEIPSAEWLIHGVINLPISTLQFTSCLKHVPVGRYEKLGDSYIHEVWELPFLYKCLNGMKEVFLSGSECKTSVSHSMICKQLSLHGACNASVENLACYLKGVPVPLIKRTFQVLSNGSYVLLNSEDCCGMRAGIVYVVLVTKVVTCCRSVLFTPTKLREVADIWPHIATSKVNFDKLSRLKALLFQKHVALTSARETYALQMARSSAEIQSQLNTNFPSHFVELMGRIFNASSTAGLAHFFKAVGVGFIHTFSSIFGLIPLAIHSIFRSILGGFPITLALLAGILLLLLFFRNGCPLQQGRMWALPSAQLCRERMMQHFGATLLGHLECDWSLSFRPVLDCVQPVFRCRWCDLEHALDVCFSQQRPLVVDADLLMFPMRAHYQTCALRLRLLREADYEIPFLEEVDINLFTGSVWDAALVDTGALEHTCSLIVFGVDFLVLSSAEVENLLLSMTNV